MTAKAVIHGAERPKPRFSSWTAAFAAMTIVGMNLIR